MDLNLLVVFEAVMNERSVTRASQRLNVSQSTISHALNRLRQTLDDELFVREGGVMRPTARAMALSSAALPPLSIIQAALRPARFDPASAVHTFNIAMTDYAATLHLESLSSVVRTEAPNINLNIKINIMGEVWGMLDKGEIDVVLGMIDAPPSRFAAELLYEDGVVVVMAEKNRFAANSLTLDAYAAAKHLYIPVDGIMPYGAGRIDRILETKGLARRHVMTISTFALAPAIIQESDYIMSVPRRLGELCQLRFGLHVVNCPVKIPSQPTRIAWHPQVGASAANAWLIQTLRRIAAS